MEDEIGRRVLPYEKQRKYPAQIVAEYLREYFSCEAVIYGSSMIYAPAHSYFCIQVIGERSDVAAHCPCRHSTRTVGLHSERKERLFP
ncbi:MAG: hypothetical protein WBE48_11545 [Xanthobacteraceae bacterium]